MKKKIMAIAVSALMLLQGANAFAYGVYSDSVQDTELVVNGGRTLNENPAVKYIN